jgi:hypothetical protein
MREKGLPWTPVAYEGAAQHGHLTILKYLHENGCPKRANDGTACANAALHGYLDCLKFLHEHGFVWSTDETPRNVDDDDDEDIYIRPTNIVEAAVQSGDLTVLKYVLEQGCEIDASSTKTCDELASRDYVEMLRYVHQLGCT